MPQLHVNDLVIIQDLHMVHLTVFMLYWQLMLLVLKSESMS